MGSSKKGHPSSSLHYNQERSRRSYDAQSSFELDSDLDATEFLQSDPLTSSKPSTGTFSIQPRKRWLRRSWSCLTGRSTKYVVGCLGIFALIWLALSAGGFFAFKKYRQSPPDGLSPPWYPTPKGGTARSWAEAYRKASGMVANMTLPEKVNVTTGTGWKMGLAVGNTGPAVHVGFPSLALQDGPLGIRFADNATAFPAGVTVGATWNKELMYQWGNAHAIEARKKGINAILGPCIGPLGRMPAGGRNWEGFGADPYLQGIAAAQSIKGIQDEGVMATIKHLVANEQEHFRQPWEWGLPNALSTNIDDRTMHELYLWPFGDAVKAGVASVMCSYNMINNSYACGNSKLLNGLLRDEMGFQGFVMSDWLAQRSGVASALAGLDMTMPGDGLFWEDGKSLWGSELTRSILNGSVPLDRLNDMVTRIVAAWYQLGQDDEDKFDRKGPNFSSWTDEPQGISAPGSPTEQQKVPVNQYVDVMGDHASIARRIAAEGTVLLKNEGILPLSHNYSGLPDQTAPRGDPFRIAIFGEDAGPGKGPNHCPDRGCNQGTLASGWGSGSVEFPYLVTPAEALTKNWEGVDGVKVSTYLTNNPPTEKQPEILEDAELCIIFANADSGEGFKVWEGVKGDRPNLFLQKGGDDLIIQVAQGCHGGTGDVIVIIHTVGPVLVEKWIDLPNIKAVLFANLPGQESGNALADVMFGDVNPSGKLPWTIGKSLDDYGEGAKIMYMPNGVVPQQDFKEGLYVDYRYFDKYGIEPRFEFGFGLSYTTFEFTDCVVTGLRKKSAQLAPRPEDFAIPPEYDATIPNAEEALFPKGIRRLEKYVYPYLDTIDDIVSDPYPYPDGYDVKQPPSSAGGDEGGNPDLWDVYVTVSVKIANTGGRAGQVVPQLYLSYPQSDISVDFPAKVLRGFDKFLLREGETTTATFNLTRRDLSYWDVQTQNWRMVVEGSYKFMVGRSSRDLPVSGTW
ncbi:glycoside hydrolase family 3 protein [Daldinia caldariorum]|uniref:glycoside hydrolase family 3 protein n=1 Tax=Daldinia caldariorum TaxID=326644 RepID=UPI002007A75E|nr:glycoside hydrolase family 3 protein [Daldinia caldariorum]KAI1463745.1 glycoside hydrolase family 3 protein [Daldinia caldariorum]